MKNILTEGAEKLKIALPPKAAAQFLTYFELLEKKNKVMNLTAISGEDEVARLHFLDSLALLPLADFKGKRVIDVGSGAGFPGLPLKIAEPTIELTLLDSLQKRVLFLEEVCESLSLEGVACLHARAEEAAQTQLRSSFDIAVSRAVARLSMLCEMCLPFVKTDGLFIAMKSVDSDGETDEAMGAIALLGGAVEQICDYSIPETDIIHRAVIIRKTADTPAKYPRRFAKMQKDPL